MQSDTGQRWALSRYVDAGETSASPHWLNFGCQLISSCLHLAYKFMVIQLLRNTISSDKVPERH